MRQFILVLLLLLTSNWGVGQHTINLGSCADDLETLKSRADDASDAAQKAKAKLSDLSDCRENPQIYDIFRDGCRAKRSDYESALSNLDSSMDDVDTAVHSVAGSCGYEFTIGKISSYDAAQRSLCKSYRRLVILGMNSDMVFQQCKTQSQMGEQWCKACLSTKP